MLRLRRLLHGTLSTVQDCAEHLEAERSEEPPAKGPLALFPLRDLKEHLKADDP